MSKVLVKAQLDGVPWTTPREKVSAAIEAYFSSYPLASESQAAQRADLFCDDFSLEDPVGAEPITNKDQLLEFFKLPLAMGITIKMRSERIIVSGDEAISFTYSTISVDGQEPAYMRIVHNFAFTSDGKIRSVRIFFDENCFES